MPCSLVVRAVLCEISTLIPGNFTIYCGKGICFPPIQRLGSFPVEPWKARLEHFAPLPQHCSTMPSRCWQEAQPSCHSSILVPLAVGPRFKAHSTTLTHVTCALYHPTLDTHLTLYGNTKTTTSPCKIAQHFLGFPSTRMLLYDL